MDIGPDDIVCTDQMDILDPTDIYGHVLVMGESDRCLIHDSQILMECFFEWEYIIADSISVFFGIFVIDTIYFGSLDHTVTLELESSQYGC
jgi:hypothetical protein